MSSSEAKFPVNIVDINSGLLQLAVTEAFERFDAPERGPVPLTEKSYDLLTAFLANPFALDGYHGNVARSRAANFVWRLGIAHNMSRLVLAHAHDVLSMDPDIVDMAHGTQVAHELLRSDPAILREPRTYDERTLFQLMEYEPGAEADYASTIMAVQLLSYATYVPAHILEDMRRRRDTTATITHEPRLSIAGNGHEMASEVDHVSEREKELREAQVRVMCGALVATHSQDKADKSAYQEALADFSYRALRDGEGLFYALETAGVLREMSAVHDKEDKYAAQLLTSHLTTFIGSFDVRDVAVSRLCEMVEAANHLADIPCVQAFIERAQVTLHEYVAFVKLTADPATERGAEATLLPSKMHAISRSAAVQHAIEAFLQAKEIEAPTDKSVLRDLQEQGYSYTALSQAIKVIGAELDPDKRYALTLQFDEAIGRALQQLPDDHPIHREGLKYMNSSGVNHVAYLAYFKSSRLFLHTMLQHYVKQTEDQLTVLNPWEGWSHPADYTAAHCAKTIHDTLWHNRYHYILQEDDAALAQPLLVITRLADFVLEKGESPGAFIMIKELVEGLKLLQGEMQKSSSDPQELAAQDPIEAILSRYTTISKR